jgi:hypothetical protein
MSNLDGSDFSDQLGGTEWRKKLRRPLADSLDAKTGRAWNSDSVSRRPIITLVSGARALNLIAAAGRDGSEHVAKLVVCCVGEGGFFGPGVETGVWLEGKRAEHEPWTRLANGDLASPLQGLLDSQFSLLLEDADTGKRRCFASLDELHGELGERDEHSDLFVLRHVPKDDALRADFDLVQKITDGLVCAVALFDAANGVTE